MASIPSELESDYGNNVSMERNMFLASKRGSYTSTSDFKHITNREG